jgi:hypothetical protein
MVNKYKKTSKHTFKSAVPKKGDHKVMSKTDPDELLTKDEVKQLKKISEEKEAELQEDEQEESFTLDS